MLNYLTISLLGGYQTLIACDILILLFYFRFLQLNNLLNKNHVIDFNVNPLNANLTKWSKTESFVGKSRPIV